MQSPQSASEDAVRWLRIAERLLSARDLIPSRSFATRARTANPSLTSSAEEILTIVETLIAGDERIINKHPNWYAVLGLAPEPGSDDNLVAMNYQKRMLILNPKRNKYSFADQAYRLVIQAWSVLSNPSRKALFDNQLAFYLKERQVGLLNNPSPTMHQNSIYFGNSAARGISQPPKTNFLGGNFSPAPSGSGGPTRKSRNLTANHVFGSVLGCNSNLESFNNRGAFGTAGQQSYSSLFIGNSSASASVARGNYSTFVGNSSASNAAAGAARKQSYSTIVGYSPASSSPAVTATRQHSTIFRNSFIETWKQSNSTIVGNSSASSSTTSMGTGGQQSFSIVFGKSSASAPAGTGMAQQQSYLTLVGNSSASSSTTAATQLQLDRNCTQSQQTSSIVWDLAGRNPNLGPDNTNGDNLGILPLPVKDDGSVFWTVCPYCYYLYEYPRMYMDCALLCHQCKRTSQAVAVKPPSFLDTKRGIYYTWGFLPFGISMENLDKHKGTVAPDNWAQALPFTEIRDFMEGSSGARVSAIGDGAFTDIFQTRRELDFGSLVDIRETNNRNTTHVQGNGAMAAIMSNVSAGMNNTLSDNGKGVINARGNAVPGMAMPDMTIGELSMVEMAVNEGNQPTTMEINFGKLSTMRLGNNAGTKSNNFGTDFSEAINTLLNKGRNATDAQDAVVCPTIMEIPNMIQGESSAVGSGINMEMHFSEVMSSFLEKGESSMMELEVDASEQHGDAELNDFDLDINMEFGNEEAREPPLTSDMGNGFDCMEDNYIEHDKSSLFEGLDELFVKLPYASVFNNYNATTVA